MWQSIKNLYHLLVAFFSALYFRFPSRLITVIGVTGTDGKTTTVNMIYHILKSASCKTSMISSVNAQIAGKTYETGFHVTTPNPFQIQKFLRQAVDNGDQYFVLEATSHGLDQNRLAYIDFKIAAFTNITQDHFDYHKNWQNYALAKLKLFRNVGFSILNLDDQKSYRFFKDKLAGKVITYGKNVGNINLKNYKIKLKIPGDFNLQNALCAVAVCQSLGLNKQSIIKSLATFPGVSGRLEEVNLGQNFKVVIDFAHTPNGLKNALLALKPKIRHPQSKLIAVFGAAGERDQSKRPLMGKVADEIADVIILTAEDPRSEKLEDIVSQIASGIKRKKLDRNLFIIPNRKEAVRFAVKQARSKDIIAIFGKGHEKSMNYGRGEEPWDEFATVKEAIFEK